MTAKARKCFPHYVPENIFDPFYDFSQQVCLAVKGRRVCFLLNRMHIEQTQAIKVEGNKSEIAAREDIVIIR